MPIMNSGLITNRPKVISLPLSRASWSLPPAVPLIGSDEAQVWQARLDEEKAAGLSLELDRKNYV